MPTSRRIRFQAPNEAPVPDSLQIDIASLPPTVPDPSAITTAPPSSYRNDWVGVSYSSFQFPGAEEYRRHLEDQLHAAQYAYNTPPSWTWQGTSVSTGTFRGGSPTDTRTPVSMQTTKETLRRLVYSRGLRGALPLIRCGFEFEFHSLRSLDRQRGQPEVPQPPTVPPQAPGTPSSRALQYAASLTPPALVERYALLSDSSTFTDSGYSDLVYPQAEGVVAREHTHPINLPGWTASGLQLGSDASVRGGEIRTVGPRSIPEFLRAARVLSRANFEIGVDTSFHIHLSVSSTELVQIPGKKKSEVQKIVESPVDHRWGARFQSEMYAYLLSNMHRLPGPVRERMLAETGGKKWARFQVENGQKYSAIYQNREYGTWEFRIFGNITRYPDMVRCLSLAVDTMRHAYSVKLKLKPSLLEEYSTDSVRKALAAIYTETTPEMFWQYLAERGQEVRSIEEEAA